MYEKLPIYLKIKQNALIWAIDCAYQGNTVINKDPCTCGMAAQCAQHKLCHGTGDGGKGTCREIGNHFWTSLINNLK